ncbi:hypothetical protein GCM10023322_45160 [Rugosimonospora acidiphila]|uniref:Uncharacterized protein n=1 Tax=Rugosimonospora acidiphila TaxID=556531 RepID=A0ABP9S361_9ACTN
MTLALTAVALGLIGQALLAGPANASLFNVKVQSAVLKNGQLQVQGSGGEPGTSISAESTVDVADVRVGNDGRFKIEASNFHAPDCLITVRDADSPLVTAKLQGCTPSTKPVQPPAPPTGSCVIAAQTLVTLPGGVSENFGTTATLAVGNLGTVNFTTTGCNFGSGTTPTQVQWKLVAGVIPTGMSGPQVQGHDAANITGIPSVAGTYEFTLQATDAIGATDQENFTVVVS